ncbi:MAG: helix-turn-helix transcriptional regulator [Clostridia bacterium]|nr:helix-turn-helix transcriptional regulator [Clostridia bacterium]
MDINQDYVYIGETFSYEHRTDVAPNRAEFVLHNHNNLHEIIFFIRGNAEFKAEGSIYSLGKHDIVIAHCDEMHRMCHIPPMELYERVVIHIKRGFFAQNGCERFLDFFTKRPLGVNNLIPAELVKKENIPGLIQDFDRHIGSDKNIPDIVATSKLIEILYRLNRITVRKEEQHSEEEKLKNVIAYINENIASELSLDQIAEHVFVSKYHLCHTFKKYSGLTINQYINHKRILLVRTLVARGWTLLDAATEAGFGNYSNFYKTYVKITGHSPRQDMK